MKQLICNVLGLFFIQLGNMLAPLLIIPCLSQITSTKEMGVTLFSLSYLVWLTLFVEFGFSLSGSRKIAQYPSEKREIFSNIQNAKFILCFFCMFVSALIGLTLPVYDGNFEYLYVTVVLGIIIGMNPIWYFQGRQKVLLPSIIDTLGTLVWIGTVLLFSPVNKAGLFSLYSLLLIKATIYGSEIIYLSVSLKVRWSGVSNIIKEIRDGSKLFFFKLAISLYTTGNVILLGYLVAPEKIGFFIAAERIAKAANNILFSVVNGLYPKISSLVEKEDRKINFINRVSLIFMLIATLFFVLFVFMFGEAVLKLLLGDKGSNAFPLLKVISLAVPFIALSNVLGFQCLIPKNYESDMNRIMLFTGVVNIICAFLLTFCFGIIGMAWNIVAMEILVLTQMIVLILTKRITL